MQQAGYAIEGPGLRGPNGWRGSEKEVKARIQEHAKRRAAAQAQLDSALMDDDVRETQEAESKRLRDAFNAMNVRVGPDGHLAAYDDAGEVFDVSKMTPLQRRAFERMDALQRPVTEGR